MKSEGFSYPLSILEWNKKSGQLNVTKALRKNLRHSEGEARKNPAFRLRVMSEA